MRMFRKILLAGSAAMLLLGSTASAGTLVLGDAGNLNSFTLTNLGGDSFTVTITAPDTLTTINSSSVSIPAAFDAVLAFTASVSGTDVTVTSGTYTKTFGTAPGDAALSYNIKAGQIGTGLNSNGLLLSGTITAVAPNALPGWDFTSLIGGTNTFSLTGTSYTGGAASIADVFAIAGSSVTGSGGFSESASGSSVPEPSSIALLGIGLCGLFKFCRFLKRASYA